MAHLLEALLWDDPDFLQLSDGARALYLCLLCGPDRSRIPGLFRTTVVTLSETLRRPLHSIEHAMKELEHENLTILDCGRRVIAVPKAPRYTCPYSPNPNQLKSWWACWHQVPDCDQKIQHIPRLIPAINMGNDAVRKIWGATFGEVVLEHYGADSEYAKFSLPRGTVVQLSEHRRRREQAVGGSPPPQTPGPSTRNREKIHD